MKIHLIMGSLILSIIMQAAYVHAASIPPLQGHVNDMAGMFTPAAAAHVEQILAKHEAETTNQVVVVTIPDLAGEDIEGYSIRLAEAWKIGQKGKDNGVIILFSRDERKIRIEVGYGLEGVLTDAQSGRIIRDDIAPHFKQGRFDDGLKAGVNSVVKVIKGEYIADTPVKPEPAYNHSLMDTLENAFEFFLEKILVYAGIGLLYLIGGALCLLILYAISKFAFFHNDATGWIFFLIFSPVLIGIVYYPLAFFRGMLYGAGIYPNCILIFLIFIYVGVKLYFLFAKKGRAFAEKHKLKPIAGSGSGRSSSFRSSYSSSRSFSSSSSGSSYSGGGGSFGGGGASGGW